MPRQVLYSIIQKLFSVDDPCIGASNPCNGHGTCHSYYDTYNNTGWYYYPDSPTGDDMDAILCSCANGFTGQHCEGTYILPY